MALIIGIVAVLIIIFGFLCYKKAPPTEAIVVTGFGLSKPKVVSGKGTFVLPVLQRADKLNMRLLKIDVKTPETGVKTQNGVSLWIDSVVTIQVYSENSTVLDDEVKASGEDFWDWVIYKDRIEKLKILISPHFKCKCKCGKTHYYNEETLLSLPKYCIYPVPISTKHTYSTKANNARYNKVRKFEILENGIICNKDDCLPSEKILCRVEQV